MTERLHFHFSLSCIGEGNGNPVHCSCLENPRDGGAWWAAVSGVTQSWTWLKRLSSSSSNVSRQSYNSKKCLQYSKESVHISCRSDRKPLLSHQIRSDQSLSRVPLFVTPWTAARQACLSLTNSRSLLKLMSIELVIQNSNLCFFNRELKGLTNDI